MEDRVADAFICGAVRTPVGKRRGGLSTVHPSDLGAHVLAALMTRTAVDPAAIDDVIFGCVTQIGAQAFNIARTSWLAADLPETVPATTVDRQCGSSLQALHFAAQGVMSGTAELIVAGGVEAMSQVPIWSAIDVGREQGLGDAVGGEGFHRRYPHGPDQFLGAQMIAERWEFDRSVQEQFALRSHQRAAAAWEAGYFDEEVAPLNGVTRDEGVRADTTLERMAELETLPGYDRLTAAVASQVSDGAAALLVASERAVAEHGLEPLARIEALAVVGVDPVIMLTGPIPATERLLARAGIGIDAVDLFEVNEAFAPVVLAWLAETGADPQRTNVNGGAIALGHPLGATGAKLVTTLVHELARREAHRGLVAICEGGGTANGMLIQRV
jgi:acetyl-CoA C-acetyltransferase